jgi:putative glutamine amidotransferase
VRSPARRFPPAGRMGRRVYLYRVTRPIIGVCAAVERVKWGPWDETVAMLPRSYIRAVQAAGGLPVLLPPDDAVAEEPDALLDRVDALILAGGADIDPASYGARPHPDLDHTVPERDRFELALAHRALERELPLLAICRGMQMLNVACGGTLHQHVPDVVGHEEHRHTPGQFTDHEVELESGSLAARAVGSERSAVKSHHHQGVDELGEGLVASGWADDDGLVEAIEDRDRRFVLGVLWHPEQDESSRLIAALVDEARQAEPQPRSNMRARS